MKAKLALLMVPMLVLVLSGCVDNSQISTPTPSPTRTEPIITAPIVTDTAIPDETEAPLNNIGQSVNDGNTKMTLNAVRFAQTIGDAKAESGKQFLILNVTIENIGPGKNLSYPGSQFIVLGTEDGVEVIYEVDESLSPKLEKSFNGEDMVPGDKRQGDVAFQVPGNATGLRLRFEYSLESSEELKLEFFALN